MVVVVVVCRSLVVEVVVYHSLAVVSRMEGDAATRCRQQLRSFLLKLKLSLEPPVCCARFRALKRT